MIVILFGLPGAGKTYVGNILQKHFGYFHYDGDLDVPESMRKAIETGNKITSQMRNEFFKKLFTSVAKEKKKHTKLVVSQTFIKERFRKAAIQHFPEAMFVLVTATPKVRAARLSKQDTMLPLESSYARKMDRRFEKPSILHVTIVNNEEGSEHLLPQLKKISL